MSNTTKRALAESLRKLLAVKALDKITVSDIVDDCGVNRQTFYYHFHDIYDLIEWILEDDAARCAADQQFPAQWQELFRGLFEFLTDNAPLVLNTYHSSGWEYVAGYLRRRLRPALEYTARAHAAGMDVTEDDLRFVVDIYQSAAVGIIEVWLGNDMRTEYSDDIERLIRIVDGSIQSTLAKFDRKPRLER
jgi:probable dihydroxyacetone kinase regulator